MKFPEKLKISTTLVDKILCTFIKEEVTKVGISKVVLGLSGGIDSALTCFLATKALGKENVIPVIMPSASSSKDSISDAKKCIKQLALPRHYEISVSPQVENYFKSDKTPKSDNEAERKNRIGNKMARERMCILYDISAVEQALVIGTSNKSELLLGYGTLFGDMASAINPIGDLYKMQVYELSEYLKIPESILNKKPSADLWKGQTDEAQLGFSYYEVDNLLYYMVDRRYTKQELLEDGFDENFVLKVQKMIQSSQFKRRLPVIAKLGQRTIDRDFNYARDWGY